ncbi:DNA-binding protein [Lutibacter sp. HS1-25]|uniref:helix-turn-helix domain-containing protein n=1 Tax=Lutibacter sp. HS1-25 TaxID=2485000 RepID=UPI0010133AC2|nr:helix-turn-helix domain-containing protein [Lutibacter sp. HS1-25]RXP46866.1 DNA-binding protein [Lutibacter sp. HS1-25]
MKTIQIENATLQEMLDGIKLIVNSSIQNSIMNESKNDELLTREETSKFLRVSYPTLNSWAKKKILIPLSLGTRIYYRKDEVIKSMKPIYNINLKN